MPSPTKNQKVVEILRDLYENEGKGDYIGDPVSKTVHSCQAGSLAELDGQDKATIIGSFLHDVGHLVGERNKLKQMTGTDGKNLGIVNHGVIGAEFLCKLGFPSQVTIIVREHVNAKKYLCYKHPEYHDNLSEASKATLKLQGGPMTEQQAIDFEKYPQMIEILKARSYDEKAKKPEWNDFKSLELFLIMIANYLDEIQIPENHQL